MKRTDFFLLYFTITVLIMLAASLFYISNQFPNIFDIEHAQQAYKKTVANPRTMSAEEVTSFIGLSIKADKAVQEVIENLFKGFQLLGFILLTLALNMSLVMISIYKRKKHENC